MSNNNTMDNTSQIELFQKYCSLLKKQDFDNANTLFNEIDWFRFYKVGYHNVLKGCSCNNRRPFIIHFL